MNFSLQREKQITVYLIPDSHLTENKLLVGTHLPYQPSWLQSATMPRFWETCQRILQGMWCWALRHYMSVFLLRILPHIRVSYCLCTNDGHFIISSVVNLVTDMIAVVLSRVAANKFSTMDHRPVIIDILCILRHFVVPAGKMKFSPLPRSVLLRLRYIRFSIIFIINWSYVSVFPPYPASHQVSPLCEALTLVQHLQFGIQLCSSLKNAFYTYLLTAAHGKEPARERGVSGGA